MTSKMHITELHIKNYRQFHDIHFDFCDPATGKPLDRICFIGSNGTGKSTLLSILSKICQPDFLTTNIFDATPDTLVSWQVQLNEKQHYSVIQWDINLDDQIAPFTSVFSEKSGDSRQWDNIWNDNSDEFDQYDEDAGLIEMRAGIAEYQTNIELHSNHNDLAIHSLPDGIDFNLDHTVPGINLSNALAFFKDLPAFHRSSSQNLADFWNFLLYQIKKRESDYQTFLSFETTQALSVKVARQKFDAENPSILRGLAEQWDLILEQAGLEFDVESAKIPVQLNENLEAYIRLKNNKDVRVDYNILSSGIRNFIFRLGHIYTLYFNRRIERGFLFLDEPEQSLYPDLLYDIIGRYEAVIHNTQLFVATHSEIVAAQFKPEERIRLQFEDDGSVSWRRGVSPEGDDPNDVLVNDFSVRSLYGKEGIKQWQHYQALKRKILETDDIDEKTRLMAEYLKIGTAYNFAPNEIPE